MDELERHLRSYPPLIEYVRRVTLDVEGYEDRGLEDPLDVLGDRALFSLLLLKGDVDGVGLTTEWERKTVAEAIIAGVPVLWKWEMVQSALELPIPDHVIADDVSPYPVMWWRLGKSAPEFESCLVLNVPEKGETVVVIFRQPVSEGKIVSISGKVSIKHGTRWPDDVTDENTKGWLDILLRMFAFMNSRFVESAETRIDRASRRRIERSDTSDVLRECDTVHTIRLRSPEPDQSVSAGGGTGNWHHRWIVRGHYRAQWYPSKQSHKVQWIAPYVKGPADKPVKLPVVVVRQ